MKIYIDLQTELLQSVYALKEGLSRVQVSQQIRAGKIKTRVIPELDLKLVVVEDVNDPLIEAPAIHHYTNQELSKFFLDLLRANTSKEQEHEAIIKELNVSIETHKSEKETLEIGKAQLTAALNEATDLLEGAREVYKKVVEDNGILTGELNTSIEENTNLARSLDQSFEENKSLAGRLDQTSQEVEKLTDLLKGERLVIAQLQQTLRELNQVTDMLQIEREAVTSKLKELTGQYNDAVNIYTKAGEENKQLSKSLDQAHNENKLLSTKLDHSGEEIKKLAGQLQEEKRQNISLKDRIAHLEEEKKSQAIAQSHKDMEDLKSLIKQILIESKSAKISNKG